jgi:hypothetical protein
MISIVFDQYLFELVESAGIDGLSKHFVESTIAIQDNSWVDFVQLMFIDSVPQMNCIVQSKIVISGLENFFLVHSSVDDRKIEAVELSLHSDKAMLIFRQARLNDSPRTSH